MNLFVIFNPNGMITHSATATVKSNYLKSENLNFYIVSLFSDCHLTRSHQHACLHVQYPDDDMTATLLQAIIGAVNPNPSNGFSGAALYISGSTNGITGEQDVSSLSSLSRLRDINGTTIIQGTALVNLTTGLQASPSHQRQNEILKA